MAAKLQLIRFLVARHIRFVQLCYLESMYTWFGMVV